jgi:polyphosphate kinase 2 (PPK2 family)
VGRLDELDLSLKLSREEEAERLDAAQKRLLQLRLVLGGLIEDEKIGPPLCVVFEGWDASGKGGAIKRLVAPLDPRHVRVKQFAAPTYDEKRHHWLWRFWPPLPGWGGMAVLDRSWYGRVLVERVEGFAEPAAWQRAYGEIVEFERMLVDEGMMLVKFWLHVSSKEQKKRFDARAKDPLKTWKLTDEDWRNRKQRRAYEKAVEDMVAETSTDFAPWTLVEADSKRYARVKVVETTVAAIEDGMKRHGMKPPPPLYFERTSTAQGREGGGAGQRAETGQWRRSGERLARFTPPRSSKRTTAVKNAAIGPFVYARQRRRPPRRLPSLPIQPPLTFSARATDSFGARSAAPWCGPGPGPWPGAYAGVGPARASGGRPAGGRRGATGGRRGR